MAKECSFTSGQLFAVYDVFGTIPPVSYAAMPNHMGLRTMLQFTAEEKVAVKWTEVVAPIGMADSITFEPDIPMTRKLTGGQRKWIAETIQKAVTKKTPAYFECWLIPVLKEIGYPMQEADWEDEDE